MRHKWRLYQGWYFRPEDLSDQAEEMGPRERMGLWEEVTIPHTFRLEPCHKRGITTAQGIGTYVKYFPLDAKLKEKTLYLTFDAVMGVTDVWLTAVESIYITDPLYENVECGGGIILEYPVVLEEKAIVSVKTQIRSVEETEQTISLTYEITELSGNSQACRTEQIAVSPKGTANHKVEIEMEHPFLWSPNSPCLYNMIVSVQKEDVLIDQKTVRFGIRNIEVDREHGLFINGELQPFLSGINRHQDYPLIGNAAPSAMQKRDAILFKEAGFSVVRAVNYPMSEEFLNACDELGLLLFEATPGWQWYPTSNPEPFSSRVRENIRQMVRRDRNHPCILAYETVLNETYHVPYGFSRESAKAALAEQLSAKIASESYGYDASPQANGIDREADFVFGFQQPLEKTEKAVMFLREYADSYIEFFGQFESRRVTRGRTDGFYPCGEARNLIKAIRCCLERQKRGIRNGK